MQHRRLFSRPSRAVLSSHGGRVAWFNAELVLDPFWMLTLGIPEAEVYWGEPGQSLENTHFHVYEPPYLENGMETLRSIAATNKKAPRSSRTEGLFSLAEACHPRKVYSAIDSGFISIEKPGRDGGM